MPLPGNVSTLVVLGTFLTPEGNPSTGTITFTPSRWLTNSGANVALPNSGVTKTLGTAGNFTVTLPVTDDGDLQPANWYYTVSEVVDGVSQSYALLLPGTAGSGGTVYLADLAPAAELGPEYASLRGPAGEAATLAIGTTTSVANAGTASVTNVGTNTNGTLNFVLRDGPTGPQGIQGIQGVQGNTGTFAIGTTTSVTNSGTASVSNVGSSTAGTFDFVLRDGPTGPTGPQGPTASLAVGTVTSVTNSGTASVTNVGSSSAGTFDFVLRDGPTGPQGATGTAATITIGTIGTVAFPGPGTVTNSGTTGAAVLDFILVTGPQGDLAGLSANAPIAYASNTFSLNVGSGLETAGTTLAVTYGTVAAALGTTTAGTVNRAARQDHVHALPTAADIGAVGNALVQNKADLVTATGNATPARLAVGSNGDALVADSTTTTGLRWQPNYNAGRNRIINGGFDIWQRGTSFASGSLFQYTADRWFGNSFAGVTCTVSRESFTPGAAPVAGYEGTYHLRLVRGAGTVTAASYLTQRIEDVRTFAGQTVTVSFYAKLASAGTVTVSFDQKFGSGGSSDVIGSGTNLSVTTSWAQYSATISVASVSGKTIGASSFLDLVVTLPQALGNCTFDIWGVQVEAGSVATRFEEEPFEATLRKCQRYYQRFVAGTGYGRFGIGSVDTITTALCYVNTSVAMRVTPTAIDTTGTASNYAIYDAGTIRACSAVPTILANSTDQTSVVTATASSLTTGRAVELMANNVSTAYIGLSAEL